MTSPNQLLQLLEPLIRPDGIERRLASGAAQGRITEQIEQTEQTGQSFHDMLASRVQRTSASDATTASNSATSHAHGSPASQPDATTSHQATRFIAPGDIENTSLQSLLAHTAHKHTASTSTDATSTNEAASASASQRFEDQSWLGRLAE